MNRAPGLAALPSRVSMALLPLALLAGCDDGTGPSGDPPAIVSHQVTDAGGPIYRTLDVELGAAAAVEVLYGAPGIEQLRVTADSVASRHRIFLPRLRAGMGYAYEVRRLGGGAGDGDPARGDFSTGELPAPLEGIRFLPPEGTPTHPLHILPVMVSLTGFSGPIVVDAEGRIVWYWETPGFTFGTTRLGHDFVFLSVEEGLLHLSPDRQLLGEVPSIPYGGIHHGIATTPQGTILFAAYETREVEGESVRGEAIWEWDPGAGTVEQRWSSWDHLSWPDDAGPHSTALNWMHLNGIGVGPRGNTVVSMRNIDQVLSISPDWSTVEWRLGTGNATIPLSGAARFEAQHDPSDLGGDRILLFDNGRERSPARSRALELQLDPEGGTAEVAWSWEPEPANFASLVSSARRLEGGNTLILFGTAAGTQGSTGPLVLVEVDPAGNEVYRLEAELELQRVFQAIPTGSIAGEVVVPD